MRAAISILVVGAVLQTRALADRLTGSGHVVDQTRTVGDFSKLEVGSGIRVKVEAGPRGPLLLRGEDNILPHVRTEIRGAALRIELEPNLSVNTREPVQVTLRAPSLDGLAASGGSQLDASTPSGDTLEVAASGGSHLHLAASVRPRELTIRASGGADVAIDAVSTGKAGLSVSGAATVSLAGDARQLDLDYSGAAQIRAGKLSVGALEVQGSGGATASVRVAGPARGRLSGGSRLDVGPDASVEVETSGGAEVTRR